jgi:hypothetical protein
MKNLKKTVGFVLVFMAVFCSVLFVNVKEAFAVKCYFVGAEVNSDHYLAAYQCEDGRMIYVTYPKL